VARPLPSFPLPPSSPPLPPRLLPLLCALLLPPARSLPRTTAELVSPLSLSLFLSLSLVPAHAICVLVWSLFLLGRLRSPCLPAASAHADASVNPLRATLTSSRRELLLAFIERLHATAPRTQGILVFLPGIALITEVADEMRARKLEGLDVCMSSACQGGGREGGGEVGESG